MDSGDHNEGEKHHLRNFIAMRAKFFSRILSSTLWQKLSRKLISWSQLMIQSKWWEVGRIIPYDFVMYDLYFCHFKTYEILHSVLRHPVKSESLFYVNKELLQFFPKNVYRIIKFKELKTYPIYTLPKCLYNLIV